MELSIIFFWKVMIVLFDFIFYKSPCIHRQKYQKMQSSSNFFNWTWTYREDSDIYEPTAYLEKKDFTIHGKQGSSLLRYERHKYILEFDHFARSFH